ncbi:hypothetical protein G9A89_009369 [Geosiphon pyriformis]|nr:hypothetical protein G9A89_009369 [Geosiphon pyriformis]
MFTTHRYTPPFWIMTSVLYFIMPDGKLTYSRETNEWKFAWLYETQKQLRETQADGSVRAVSIDPDVVKICENSIARIVSSIPSKSKNKSGENLYIYKVKFIGNWLDSLPANSTPLRDESQEKKDYTKNCADNLLLDALLLLTMPDRQGQGIRVCVIIQNEAWTFKICRQYGNI